MYVTSFKELIVWQRSMELVKEIYSITFKYPKSETYGLTDQMRRAVVSIPSNIAEGKKRKTKKDFLQFLHISNGSAAELETQLLISKDLYPEFNYAKSLLLLEEVQKMLSIMIKKLEMS